MCGTHCDCNTVISTFSLTGSRTRGDLIIQPWQLSVYSTFSPCTETNFISTLHLSTLNS